MNNLIKRNEEDDLIKSKFNGKIVMELFPDLKGKELGDTMSGFKDSIDSKSGWRNYALRSSKGSILKDFKNWYSDSL